MPTHIKKRILTGGLIGLLVVVLSLFAIYALRLGSYTANSPAIEPEIESPVVVKQESHSHIDEPVAPPTPVYAHDYVIPPVVAGIPPVVTNFTTTDPVVFLTIDDGAYKDPSVVKLLKDNNLKTSLFLARGFIQDNPDFFKEIVSNGALIENHTLSHNLKMVKEMSYEQQKYEICGMSDYVEQQYGRRPIFFRPPGGAYSDTMLQAAGACGIRAVVTWIAKANGGAMQYQIGDKLRPGDIVLMHFRPEFAQDLQAFIDAMHASGLHTELLEEWV